MSSISAVFLDRDGTIIDDLHYPKDADKVTLIPNAAEGLRSMMKKGYLLFVVSNQSGVGRGIIQDHEFQGVHQRTYELLQAEGVEIAEFAYCFHLPEDECECRKPQIGLIPKSFQGKPFNFKQSYMVGDKDCDLMLGINMGVAPFLILSGKGKATLEDLKKRGDLDRFSVCNDLLAVAESLPDLHPPQ